MQTKQATYIETYVKMCQTLPSFKTGTDVIIIFYFREKIGENIGVFKQITVSFFSKNLIITLAFEKNAMFITKIDSGFESRRKV
jgi:hypothetical protein